MIGPILAVSVGAMKTFFPISSGPSIVRPARMSSTVLAGRFTFANLAARTP